VIALIGSTDQENAIEPTKAGVPLATWGPESGVIQIGVVHPSRTVLLKSGKIENVHIRGCAPILVPNSPQNGPLGDFFNRSQPAKQRTNYFKYLGTGTSKLLSVGPYESADSYGMYLRAVSDDGELAAAASSCM
jgi:hypothetical protein